MGGHTSRAHKGVNDAFNKKIQKYNDRVNERTGLRLAQSFFKAHSSHDLIKYRAIVARIKRIILEQKSEQMTEYISLEKKLPESYC